MSSQTLTGISGQRQNRLTVAAVAAAIAGVAVTLIVAAVIVFGPTPARVDTPYVLGPMDDYYFRHAPAPKVLGPMDDYGIRHGAQVNAGYPKGWAGGAAAEPLSRTPQMEREADWQRYTEQTNPNR